MDTIYDPNDFMIFENSKSKPRSFKNLILECSQDELWSHIHWWDK
jgi:hypothetical protein